MQLSYSQGYISKHASIKSRITLTLRMTAMQNNNDNTDSQALEKKKSFKFSLPPPPEDHIVLGGDIIALFTYTFLDHLIAALLLEDAYKLYTEPNALQLPVWSDVASNNFGPSLLSAITAQQQMANIGDSAAIVDTTEALLSHHYYAPCLETFGVSSVLLGTCWLISGYLNEAFEYKNTVLCHPSHAIIVTGRTWIFTAMMMLGVAMWSDKAFCGCLDNVRVLTKADMAFIFDSFSVLVAWRFVASLILGSFM